MFYDDGIVHSLIIIARYNVQIATAKIRFISRLCKIISVAKFDADALGGVDEATVGVNQVLFAHGLLEGDAHYVGVVVGHHLPEASFHDELHGPHAKLGG